MNIRDFIRNFKEAFGERGGLPIAFWYSDQPVAATPKIEGCFFKGIRAVRDGRPMSLCIENIGCGGGKFYTGFTPMPPHVPTFVSTKEKYKDSSGFYLRNGYKHCTEPLCNRPSQSSYGFSKATSRSLTVFST